MVTLSFQALSRSGLNHIQPQVELTSQNRAPVVAAHRAAENAAHGAAQSNSHSPAHSTTESTTDSIQPELSLLVEDNGTKATVMVGHEVN